MAIRVGMVSLGCPKNQIDAEILLSAIEQDGFELTGDPGVADVVVINTCGFIESAKQEAIENILEFCKLKEEGKIKSVVVTGCLAQRYQDEIAKEIPEADVVLGIGSNSEIAKAIRESLDGKKVYRFDDKEKLSMNGDRIITTLPFYAYLKIAEGCDNCCTYCAIPQIRGRFRSRPMEEILDEARLLAADGVKELILVAQDTSRYGEDLYGKASLAKLLRELCKIDGFVWIRVLYCYPERITEELIQVFATEEKVAKYMDIPMQHCNRDILKKMNRKGDRESLSMLCQTLRERIPGLTLRTTLIAGFPTETEAQFEELAQFVKDTRFDRLGCFAYSQEEGTPAGRMTGQLEEETKARRAEVIMEEQMTIMFAENEKQIGKTVTVVCEGFDRYGECYFGRSEADAPEIDGKIFFTAAEDKKPHMGDFVNVVIDEVLDYDLIGHIE